MCGVALSRSDVEAQKAFRVPPGQRVRSDSAVVERGDRGPQGGSTLALKRRVGARSPSHLVPRTAGCVGRRGAIPTGAASFVKKAPRHRQSELGIALSPFWFVAVIHPPRARGRNIFAAGVPGARDRQRAQIITVHSSKSKDGPALVTSSNTSWAACQFRYPRSAACTARHPGLDEPGRKPRDRHTAFNPATHLLFAHGQAWRACLGYSGARGIFGRDSDAAVRALDSRDARRSDSASDEIETNRGRWLANR